MLGGTEFEFHIFDLLVLLGIPHSQISRPGLGWVWERVGLLGGLELWVGPEPWAGLGPWVGPGPWAGNGTAMGWGPV